MRISFKKQSLELKVSYLIIHSLISINFWMIQIKESKYTYSIIHHGNNGIGLSCKDWSIKFFGANMTCEERKVIIFILELSKCFSEKLMIIFCRFQGKKVNPFPGHKKVHPSNKVEQDQWMWSSIRGLEEERERKEKEKRSLWSLTRNESSTMDPNDGWSSSVLWDHTGWRCPNIKF